MSVEDDKAPQLSEYANTGDPLIKEKVHAENSVHWNRFMFNFRQKLQC